MLIIVFIGFLFIYIYLLISLFREILLHFGPMETVWKKAVQNN